MGLVAHIQLSSGENKRMTSCGHSKKCLKLLESSMTIRQGIGHHVIAQHRKYTGQNMSPCCHSVYLVVVHDIMSDSVVSET